MDYVELFSGGLGRFLCFVEKWLWMFVFWVCGCGSIVSGLFLFIDNVCCWLWNVVGLLVIGFGLRGLWVGIWVGLLVLGSCVGVIIWLSGDFFIWWLFDVLWWMGLGLYWVDIDGVGIWGICGGLFGVWGWVVDGRGLWVIFGCEELCLWEIFFVWVCEYFLRVFLRWM